MIKVTGACSVGIQRIYARSVVIKSDRGMCYILRGCNVDIYVHVYVDIICGCLCIKLLEFSVCDNFHSLISFRTRLDRRDLEGSSQSRGEKGRSPEDREDLIALLEIPGWNKVLTGTSQTNRL